MLIRNQSIKRHNVNARWLGWHGMPRTRMDILRYLDLSVTLARFDHSPLPVYLCINIPTWFYDNGASFQDRWLTPLIKGSSDVQDTLKLQKTLCSRFQGALFISTVNFITFLPSIHVPYNLLYVHYKGHAAIFSDWQYAQSGAHAKTIESKMKYKTEGW